MGKKAKMDKELKYQPLNSLVKNNQNIMDAEF